MPAGFRCHLVAKPLVCHCDIAEMRFVGELVIIDIFIIQRVECNLNNAVNLRPLTPHIIPCYAHKMAIVS